MKKFTTRYQLKLVAILAVFGLTSCEKIIDISIPDRERKMVVNGLVRLGQPVWVNLSKSLSVLENESIIPIPGADVNLFHGADLVGKFREDSVGYYSLPDFKPEVGQSYRLTASDGSLNPVEATAFLPPAVPMISVDTATLTGDWGQQELRLTVKFSDPAGVHNIYGFSVDVTSKEFDYNSMTYTGKKTTRAGYLNVNTDGFLQDESNFYEGKLYFEDMLFDGLTKSVEFGISDLFYYESDTIWLEVKMEQIDPSFFLYVVSNEAYQQANGNPFSEPVQVFTNIKGGFGIFSGSSYASFPLVFSGMRKFR
jgi:hypothetical protein